MYRNTVPIPLRIGSTDCTEPPDPESDPASIGCERREDPQESIVSTEISFDNPQADPQADPLEIGWDCLLDSRTKLAGFLFAPTALHARCLEEAIAPACEFPNRRRFCAVSCPGVMLPRRNCGA